MMKNERKVYVVSLIYVFVTYFIMSMQMGKSIMDYLQRTYISNQHILELYILMSVVLFAMLVLSICFWSRKKKKNLFLLVQGSSFLVMIIINCFSSYLKVLFGIIYRAGLLIFLEGVGDSAINVLLDIVIWCIMLISSLILAFLFFCGIGNAIFIMVKQGRFY